MKLKKIASLALAGVMAVSMLAGCANKPSTNEGEVENTVTLADMLNNAETGDVKVAFTNNTALNNALQTAVTQYGLQLDETKLEAAAKLIGIEETPNTKYNLGSFQYSYNVSSGDRLKKEFYGLVNGTLEYYYNEHANTSGYDTNKLDGKTFTTIGYKTYTGFSSAKIALETAAKDMDTLIQKLPATSKTVDDTGAPLTAGKNQKYYTYSYTGDAALIVMNQPNGTTTYGVFYVIYQTLNEKTFTA